MNNIEKKLILSALDNGLDAAQGEADEYHRTMAGYRQYRHDYLDAAVVDIKAAIEILKKEEATDGLMDLESAYKLTASLQAKAIS